MKLINPEYDVPCIERTTKWVKKNVVYNDAEILLSRIQACSAELADAMGLKIGFLSENVDLPNSERVRSGGVQSKCEIAAEYMKCLANAKNIECQVFQYP